MSTSFSWTCDICGFSASTPEERLDHKANPEKVHTDDHINDASQRSHDTLMAILGKHLPADLTTHDIHVRASLVKAFGGSTRTSAFAYLVQGAISAAMTNLTREQVVDLVAGLYDASRSYEFVRDYAEQYEFANAQAKLQQAGTMVLSPASELKH